MAWLGQLQNRCSGFARFHNSNTHIRGVADTNHLSHPRLAVRLGSQPTQAGNPGTNSTYRYMGGRLSPQAQRGGRCRFIGTQCHAGRPCWPRPSSTRRLNSRFPSPDPRCCTRTYSVHRGFSRRFGHPALPRCGSLPYRVAETSLSYAFLSPASENTPCPRLWLDRNRCGAQGITSMDRLEVGQHRSGLAHGQAGCPPSP